MWNIIKGWWGRLMDGFKFVKDLFVSPAIPVVAAIDVTCLVLGHVAALAAVSSMAFVMSFVFIILGLTPEWQDKTWKAIAKYGAVIDLVLTTIFTIMALQASLTMALTIMLVGFNLSFLIGWARAKVKKKVIENPITQVMDSVPTTTIA